jgi:hypothetical protein
MSTIGIRVLYGVGGGVSGVIGALVGVGSYISYHQMDASFDGIQRSPAESFGLRHDEYRVGVKKFTDFAFGGGFLTGGTVGIYFGSGIPKFDMLRFIKGCGGGFVGGTVVTLAAVAIKVLNLFEKEK